MKKIKIIVLTILIAIFSIQTTQAQTIPQGMKYQAVARTSKGSILKEKPVSIMISLQSNDASKAIHYKESHTTTTNMLGLFSLTIGKGEVLKGKFSKIPWSSEDIWMEIAIKSDNGNFKTLSNTKLLAVPYAFHAGTASKVENEINIKGRNGVPANVWSLKGNTRSNPLVDKLGTTDSTDIVMVTNNIERLRITADGRIITGDGKFTIGGNLEVQGDSTSINRDFYVGRNVVLNFDDGFNPRGETINHGKFTVENMSASLLTGTLNVNKATDLDDLLNVDGETDLNSAFRVNNASTTNLTGTLTVDGETNLNNTFSVNNASDTNLSGILNVTGATTLNNTLAANGQVTIAANVSGGDASYAAHPLRVEGSAQGIAIKLNAGTPNNSNNFITFYNSAGGAVGRIEGETTAEASSTPEFIFEEAILVAEEVKAGVNVGTSFIPVTVGGVGVSAGPCGACIAAAAADLVLATANLVNFNVFALTNLGVTYQSGSADYAEWLERSNPSEKILAGDIVGVIGGKISKNTTGARQFMVISTKPAMLGNMPKKGQENKYEKVAFMGQIPVKVRGVVVTGDYILPSGLNDGIGIGVSPKEISADQYANIVGVAWSSSFSNGSISMINMAIGLNSNDIANIVAKQEQKIKKIEAKFSSLEARLLAFENGTKYTPTLKVEKEKPIITRAEAIEQNMPAELSDEVMQEAIASLKERYISQGIDYTRHAGLNKLFTDQLYQAEILKKTQASYKKNYQKVKSKK